MFKNVRNKLLIINLVIISIVMVVSFIFIYGITYTNIVDDNMDRIKRVPLNSLNHFRDPDSLDDEDRYEISSINSFNLLLDGDGNIDKVGSYLEIDIDEYGDIADYIFNKGDTYGEVEIDSRVWLYELSELPEFVDHNIKIGEYDFEDIESEYKISFVDITDSKEYLDNLLFLLIVIALITIVVIYFISLYFANKSIKPLEKMWCKQKEFVANATHELKTPLTIISANADVLLLDENKTIKKQKKWIEYIKSETIGMNKLINELLSSAKVEEEKYLFEKVNVSELVNECILSFETIVYEKNIKFNVEVEDNINLNTDAYKFLQVLRILLDNAFKYTNEFGYINIKLYRQKRNVLLIVSNSGNGIATDDLPHIFDRFYKCDKSRTNRGSSYGLGLYIAKSIVNKLKGTIECTSDKETTFIVKF